MKTLRQVFIVEAIMAIALSVELVIINEAPIRQELSDTYINFLSNLFELNLAIVIAFIMAIIVERKIAYKGRQLKRITKNSVLIVVINSIIMSSYGLCGMFGLAVVVPTLIGNMCRVWGICREILEII